MEVPSSWPDLFVRHSGKALRIGSKGVWRDKKGGVQEIRNENGFLSCLWKEKKLCGSLCDTNTGRKFGRISDLNRRHVCDRGLVVDIVHYSRRFDRQNVDSRSLSKSYRSFGGVLRETRVFYWHFTPVEN